MQSTINEGVIAAQDTIEQVTDFTTYLHSQIPVLIHFGMKLVLAVLVFLIGQKLLRIFRKIVRSSLQKTNVEPGVIQFLDSTLRILLYGLLIFSIASKFGLDTTSFAALLASAGVAVGLALQGSLSNFAGGILILILKPFKVGDFIIEHSQGHSGTVVEIQIFYTKLHTIDNKTVIIPNGTLSNGSITNCSQNGERRVDFKVGISYNADLRKAKEIIRNLMDQDPDVLDNEGNIVFVEDLADCSVIIGFRVWVPAEKFFDVKFRLLEEVKLAFDREGIEIPFPQVVIHKAEA